MKPNTGKIKKQKTKQEIDIDDVLSDNSQWFSGLKFFCLTLRDTFDLKIAKLKSLFKF
jgi:hypothetical protein